MKITDNIEVYLQSFVAPILGIADVEITPAMAEMIFKEISRQVELDKSVRDQWGNWDWQYSDAQRRGELYVPWLDMPLVRLRRDLQVQHPDWPWETPWPQNKRFALCLSHDVDVVSQPQSSIHPILSRLQNHILTMQHNSQRKANFLLSVVQNWLSQQLAPENDPLWHYEDWLSLEDKYGFKSTFFIFPSLSHSRHPLDCSYFFDDIIRYGNKKMPVNGMVQVINRAGWEVGLHGSYYSASTVRLLAEQRKQIEDIIGVPVISTRQHYLRYDVSVTPKLQVNAGFKVDSTQGFNRSIGFRAGTCFPYYCFDHENQRSLSILEIPQHIMDGGLFTPNALEYDEDMAIQHCIQIMDAVERMQGVLTLSWHPHYLNNMKWWNVYKVLLEEAAHRNAWGCSLRELYQWWTEREQRILRSGSQKEQA